MSYLYNLMTRLKLHFMTCFFYTFITISLNTINSCFDNVFFA